VASLVATPEHVDAFKALAHPLRISILDELRGAL